MISFVFWLALFNWSAGQVEYVWVFHSVLSIVFQDLSCYVFYFVVMIFVTTIWRHSHFLFIRSCNFNWIACVTSFFALSGASFFVHARDKIFGHTWLTSLSKMTSSIWNWLLFTLIQRDKVKWVCVTLNEGYLRSANRGSNNIQIFNQNITDQPSMKRRFFWCLFYCFRLPINESIAAIFWQSASYIYRFTSVHSLFNILREIFLTFL